MAKTIKAAKAALAALLVAFVFSQTQAAHAFIPPQDRCIDVKSIVVMKPYEDKLVTKEMVATYLPTNMTPGNDPNRFAMQFSAGLGQKITDRIMKSDFFTHSSIGKATVQIEHAAQQSVVIAPSSGGIAHKLNFNLIAAERRAELAYEGFFKSTLTYVADTNNMVWTTTKALDPSTALTLTNTMPVGQAPTSMLSITHSF